ncbi:hypothetical protein V1511DRAFT_500964 [Dipodascopsis uninucleata]
MDTTLNATLQTLLPMLTTIPAELTRQTMSLLAQSRSRVQLPQRQEHARAYVCAHITADRFRTLLMIPKASPNSLPMSARQYEKFYKMFEESLSDVGHIEEGNGGMNKLVSKLGSQNANDTNDEFDGQNKDKANDEIITWVSQSMGIPANVVPVAKMAVNALVGSNMSLWRRKSGKGWPAAGAVLYVLKFGQSNGDGREERTVVVAAATGSSKSQGDLFLARYLKLTGAKASADDIRTVIDRVRSVVYGNEVVSDAIWVQKMRRVSGKLGGGPRRHGIRGIGRMIRTSVIYLTPERQREHARWTESVLAKLAD